MLTHNRPEMLWLSLESLRKVRHAENYLLYVPYNEDSSPLIPEIVEKLWPFRYELEKRPAGWLCERANGEAFKGAADRAGEYFIQVAEDNLFSADYLEAFEWLWGNRLQEDILSFSSNLILLENPDDKFVDKYAKTQNFGYGNLVPKIAFNWWLRPLLTDEYYDCEFVDETMQHVYLPQFVQKHFPKEHLVNCLGIDGLANCVMQKNGLWNLAILKPRINTIGFWGAHNSTNRGHYQWNVGGKVNLEDKISYLRNVVADGSIKNLFGTWNVLFYRICPDHRWDFFSEWEKIVMVEGRGRYQLETAYHLL